MSVTELDLPVLDAIRGIDPLPQVPTMFRLVEMALVETKRDVLNLPFFHLEIWAVTLLQ